MTVVACCQLELQVGRAEENRERMTSAAAAALGEGAQVVVLPELAGSGYVFEDAEEARTLAEPAAGGPTVTRLTELARAHGAVIVSGLCEVDPRGGLRNSAVIVDATGLRSVYRKAHLWDREKLVFTPGDDPPPVVDTEHGRVSTVVCYDLEFPEWLRLPALAHAELLCAPTNWPSLEPIPPGERPGEVVRVQSAASINRMFVAACDRVGAERGVDWVGGSVIAGPGGYALAGPAQPGRSATLIADCDLSEARRKATSERNDVLLDRRPELYGAVARSADTAGAGGAGGPWAGERGVAWPNAGSTPVAGAAGCEIA